MLVIDESFDGKQLEMKPGEELEVHLPENPTTGFRWHVTSDGDGVVDLVDDQFSVQGTRPGAGGNGGGGFGALRPGSARIALASRRSWETAAPARTFAFDLKVDS